MPNLAGKVAIVTGAGRGIGRAHALALADAGAKVVVNDLGAALSGEGHDDTPAQQVADEIEALGGEAAANVENVADFAGAERLVEQALDHFGRLDILVNNAGILRDRMLVNMTEETFQMSAPEEGFDPLDPSNISTVVVALCADEAQAITGQVFHVWGGAVNALQGWSAGELFDAPEGWDPDALLGELLARFPDGVSPPGMIAGMQSAGGRSLQAAD